MESGFGFSGLVLPVVVVILVVAVVVFAFTRRSLANGALLSPRRLVEGYIFTVLLIAMVLSSVGTADLLRAGIARKLGVESSYRPTPIWNEDRKSNEEPKYEYDKDSPRRDILSGLAELGVGLLVGALHLLGLRRISRSEPVRLSLMYRAFLIVGLVIYTTGVLVYAVGSVKDWLLFHYVSAPPLRSWYERPVPGDQIAGLAGFLPFWALLVFFLFRFARTRSVAG